MICPKCAYEAAPAYGEKELCPHCQSLMRFQNATELFIYICKKFGRDTMNDGKRLFSLMQDLAPEKINKMEKVRILTESGVLQRINTAVGTEHSIDPRIVDEAVVTLSHGYGINAEQAKSLLQIPSAYFRQEFGFELLPAPIPKAPPTADNSGNPSVKPQQSAEQVDYTVHDAKYYTNRVPPQKTAPSAVPPKQPAPSSQVHTPNQSAAQAQPNTKKKAGALILGFPFLFGCFGGLHFYEGNWGLGLLYLGCIVLAGVTGFSPLILIPFFGSVIHWIAHLSYPKYYDPKTYKKKKNKPNK